jgi:tetratricopeptide (TPR) repeat protein
MRNRCTRTLSLLSVIVFTGLSSSMAAEIPVVRGQLHPPARELVQGLFVIIEEGSTHSEISRVDARIDGSFEFRDIPAGDYTLRVNDSFSRTVWQQFVTIDKQMSPLEVRLPERKSHGAGAGAATVSVKQLMHPPQKKAVQAFDRALRLSSAGKYDDAAGELQMAIRISPEFAAAHTNLAVQYFRIGRFEESIAESARAIQIGGPDPRNLCNLAMAHARLRRFAEAEESARAAVRLDSSYLKANLILGVILVHEPATRGEGVKHLEKAAKEFASAGQFLEQLRASR